MGDEQQGALALAVKGNFKTKKKTNNGTSGGGGSNNPMSVNGYHKSEVVSALQKCIRRDMEPEALFWAAELMASNETYRMWRRLVVIAAEDVGLADPNMVHRIWAMKQAHDFGREWNIPFLAVMILCRAPKNREADDAAYLYEEKRKAGKWRIKMPDFAIDGHTWQGKKRLYRMADKGEGSMEELWNREFYYDVGLLKHYTPDPVKEEFYRKQLMEFLGLPFDTYDIDECRQPRITSGHATPATTELSSRIPSEPDIKPATDPDTGEIAEEAYIVQSFTDPDTTYVVDLADASCTCPAWENSGGGICKHIMAVERQLH